MNLLVTAVGLKKLQFYVIAGSIPGGILDGSLKQSYQGASLTEHSRIYFKQTSTTALGES